MLTVIIFRLKFTGVNKSKYETKGKYLMAAQCLQHQKNKVLSGESTSCV